MTTASTTAAKQCDDLARAMGYRVVNLEQRRASRITQGVPDRRYVGKVAFFFELKFGADRLTREQYGFLTRELDAGAIASCGGFAELHDLFRALATPSLVPARNLCRRQVEAMRAKGFRGERKEAA